MEIKLIIAFITAIASMIGLLNGVTSSEMLRSVPPSPPKTVEHVELPKYLGKWYEIAVIPYFWETGCVKTTAEYSMNKDNKSVRVENKCIR